MTFDWIAFCLGIIRNIKVGWTPAVLLTAMVAYATAGAPAMAMAVDKPESRCSLEADVAAHP